MKHKETYPKLKNEKSEKQSPLVLSLLPTQNSNYFSHLAHIVQAVEHFNPDIDRQQHRLTA